MVTKAATTTTRPPVGGSRIATAPKKCVLRVVDLLTTRRTPSRSAPRSRCAQPFIAVCNSSRRRILTRMRNFLSLQTDNHLPRNRRLVVTSDSYDSCYHRSNSFGSRCPSCMPALQLPYSHMPCAATPYSGVHVHHHPAHRIAL
ncbi:hypothetical protein EXIGLDRAFT_847482, partial [Exidia glandulosa HHB12029]